MTAVDGARTSADWLLGPRRDVHRTDAIVLVLAGCLGVVTVFTASAPVGDLGDWVFASVGWSVLGTYWSLRLLAGTGDPAARTIALVFLLAAALSFVSFGFVTMFVLAIVPFSITAAGALGLGMAALGALRDAERRRTWLGVPALAIITLAVVASSVPRTIRFTLAEPALTEYVMGVDQRAPSASPSENAAIEVGGLTIYDVYEQDGEIHLTTAYVGILGDYPAGLAYVPSGVPSDDGRYEQLSARWYRWFPY